MFWSPAISRKWVDGDATLNKGHPSPWLGYWTGWFNAWMGVHGIFFCSAKYFRFCRTIGIMIRNFQDWIFLPNRIVQEKRLFNPPENLIVQVSWHLGKFQKWNKWISEAYSYHVIKIQNCYQSSGSATAKGPYFTGIWKSLQSVMYALGQVRVDFLTHWLFCSLMNVPWMWVLNIERDLIPGSKRHLKPKP